MNLVFYKSRYNGQSLAAYVSAQIQERCSVQLWSFKEFPTMESKQLQKFIQRVKENTDIQFEIITNYRNFTW